MIRAKRYLYQNGEIFINIENIRRKTKKKKRRKFKKKFKWRESDPISVLSHDQKTESWKTGDWAKKSNRAYLENWKDKLSYLLL